jgi:hypothetical protein
MYTLHRSRRYHYKKSNYIIMLSYIWSYVPLKPSVLILKVAVQVGTLPTLDWGRMKPWITRNKKHSNLKTNQWGWNQWSTAPFQKETFMKETAKAKVSCKVRCGTVTREARAPCLGWAQVDHYKESKQRFWNAALESAGRDNSVRAGACHSASLEVTCYRRTVTKKSKLDI